MKLPLFFVALLIVSIIVSFAVEGRVLDDVAYHLGGLSIVGLIACLAGYIARKKGREPKKVIVLGIAIPVALGGAVVLAVFLSTGFVYCGGGVVLLAALIVLAFYSFLKKRVWEPEIL